MTIQHDAALRAMLQTADRHRIPVNVRQVGCSSPLLPSTSRSIGPRWPRPLALRSLAGFRPSGRRLPRGRW
ncbi:hypothetical protein [Kitasatospora sp. NPDC001175]|uniref:hypothetical protein n=1 Tax=Kitasatospora sp. NPDC001175 TaxID=3157103 RepID=UPI003D02BE75